MSSSEENFTGRLSTKGTEIKKAGTQPIYKLDKTKAESGLSLRHIERYPNRCQPRWFSLILGRQGVCSTLSWTHPCRLARVCRQQTATSSIQERAVGPFSTGHLENNWNLAMSALWDWAACCPAASWPCLNWGGRDGCPEACTTLVSSIWRCYLPVFIMTVQINLKPKWFASLQIWVGFGII